jgi:hypothetical protein
MADFSSLSVSAGHVAYPENGRIFMLHCAPNGHGNSLETLADTQMLHCVDASLA